jgi:hypothetical protein
MANNFEEGQGSQRAVMPAMMDEIYRMMNFGNDSCRVSAGRVPALAVCLCMTSRDSALGRATG